MKIGPVILDASAVLALLNQEPGYLIVEKYLPEGLISTVNLSEVLTVLADTGLPQQEAENIVSALLKESIVFDEEQALIAAGLRKQTKAYGLSLGDRACLALGKIRKIPVLTADKSWKKLPDADVILIR